MDIRKTKIRCENCGSEYRLSPSVVKDQYIEDLGLTATYVECPVCGENSLKQLDNEDTLHMRNKVVRMQIFHKKGKLSDKDKHRLFKLNRKLDNIRRNLKRDYWDEVYQLLNN